MRTIIKKPKPNGQTIVLNLKPIIKKPKQMLELNMKPKQSAQF